MAKLEVRDVDSHALWILRSLRVLMAIGASVLCLWGAVASLSSHYVWGLYAAGMMLSVAGAAMSVGAFVGLLFGLPRSPKRSDDGPSDVSGNTNLEDVSDWLTKILVGAGLAQIAIFPSVADSLGSSLQRCFPPFDDSVRPAALATVMYFSLLGFFYAYLWSRFVMVDILRRVEQNIRERLGAVEQNLDETREDADEAKINSAVAYGQMVLMREGPGAGEADEKAVEMLHEALREHPGEREAAITLSRILSERYGHHEEAAQFLEMTADKIRLIDGAEPKDLHAVLYNAGYLHGELCKANAKCDDGTLLSEDARNQHRRMAVESLAKLLLDAPYLEDFARSDDDIKHIRDEVFAQLGELKSGQNE